MAIQTRYKLIERILRQVYGEQPRDDSNITYNLVNEWLNDGIAVAAKNNWKENIQLEGISHVNSSFYTTFKGIPIVASDDNFTWKAQLPEIPAGMGSNEGISTIRIKDPISGQVSYPLVMINHIQKGYYESMRPIPNKIICHYENSIVHLKSVVPLYPYTLTVSMISSGDGTTLDSQINVPQDYMPDIIAYITKMLMLEQGAKKDMTNDGEDD